jgi:hypothetical protein
VTRPKTAAQKRDAALYQFLAQLHYLEKRLVRLNAPRNKLEEKYRRLPRSAINTVVKLAYRGLNSKRQSKHVAVLRYVRAKKKPEQSVKSLIRKTGGINKCVAAEKKLRNRSAEKWAAK